MTLFEVLIVVAILALIAGSVGLAAIAYFDRAKNRLAESDGARLRLAVQAYWVEHDRSECPGVDQLISARGLDRNSRREDPWGTTWHVECTDDDATIISAGRDRKLGTEDDIRIPPA